MSFICILLYNTNIRFLLEGFEEFEFRILCMGDKTLTVDIILLKNIKRHEKCSQWKIDWWVQEMTAIDLFMNLKFILCKTVMKDKHLK